MTYCRKGPDSDCYIIGTGDGYECLCCPLAKQIFLPSGNEMHDSWYGKTADDLYHHMLAHVMVGQKVPLRAIERAQAEAQGREYVDPDIVLHTLLERLVSPREVFDHIVMSARIMDALNMLSDESSGWETWPEDFFDDEGWNNP